MKLNLKIYEKGNKEKIEKTYEVEGIDLMYGTIDNFISIIDVNKIDDDMAMGLMVLKALPQITPLIQDIFEGVTQEELKRTKIKELIAMTKDILKYFLEEISGVPKEKN